MKCKDCYKEGCSQRAYTDDAECVFQQWTTQEFDWQSFRNQAAKDILCAIINREGSLTRNGQVVASHQDFIEIAVEDADVLISKLKEKEEK